MTMRQEKAASLLKELFAEFINKRSGDMSLITVTRVSVSTDLKKATLYITTIPTEKEEQALLFARRQLGDFRSFVKPKLSTKFIPYFEADIDKGERNRQRIDELTRGQ